MARPEAETYDDVLDWAIAGAREVMASARAKGLSRDQMIETCTVAAIASLPESNLAVLFSTALVRLAELEEKK
jgi:hypothetical protein